MMKVRIIPRPHKEFEAFTILFPWKSKMNKCVNNVSLFVTDLILLEADENNLHALQKC